MSGETEANVSGWTIDTVHEHLDQKINIHVVSIQRQLDDLRATLNERYATQTKALDAAFLAQQTAMQTAFAAADKAVQAALESAEKAVGKAEIAAEKRFDSVNEFRQQLGDQASTFVSRVEFQANDLRLTERIQELQDRLNRSEGKVSGLNSGWVYLVGGVAVISAIVTIIIAIRQGA